MALVLPCTTEPQLHCQIFWVYRNQRMILLFYIPKLFLNHKILDALGLEQIFNFIMASLLRNFHEWSRIVC